MKRIFLLLVLIGLVWRANAQDKTILLAEAQLPYTSQTWFYSGSGNGLQEGEIKKHWDEGRRITSVAYTANGWFVTMAKSTGMGMQTYSYSADWPKEWINKKWNENYYITSISKSNSKWLVVMSKGMGYTDQSWSRDDTGELLKWYEEKSDKGFFLTSAAYNGDKWTFVMSKGSPYSSQGYFWADSYDKMKSKIKSKVWDCSYRVHTIEYGGGKYLVVYGNYSKNNGRGQNYIVDPSNVSSYIDERWEESYKIAHIGGGYYKAPTHNHNHDNNTITYNNGLGQVTNRRNPDGSMTSVTKMRCILCNGTGVCGVCFGRGGTYNAYTQLYYQCPSCFGSTRCKNCNGQGVQTMTTHVNPDGSGYGIGAGGVVTTGPGGHITSGGGSGNSGSGSHNNSNSRRVCPSCNGSGKNADQITYAPNYTGDNSTYCSQCGKVGPAHSHRRPMCRVCYGKGYVD